jgi:hypothetical protein
MHTLPTLITDEAGVSAFIDAAWPEEVRGGLVLSPRLGASSLRLRRSAPGYHAGWHVSGEPVLIVVRAGTLRIGLRGGGHRDFSAGDAFIAADALPDGEPFDPEVHGHTASVVGETPLEAVHIKLAALPEQAM